jgi:8-oxo-dGTP diphosphatase
MDLSRLPEPFGSAAQQFMMHVDGGLYRLLGVGKAAQDGQPEALYEHLHPFERGVWTRPMSEFSERFSPISETRAAELLGRDPARAREEITAAKARRRALEAAPIQPSAPRSRLHSLGFLFSPDLSRVALIRKASPAWQAGKLNGIGGKSEPGETSLDTMSREFFEEAGLNIPQGSWSLFGRLGSPDFEVHCYRAVGPVDECRTMTAEPVMVFSVNDPEIDRQALPGVGALIRAALPGGDAFWRCDYDAWAAEARAGVLDLRQP